MATSKFTIATSTRTSLVVTHDFTPYIMILLIFLILQCKNGFALRPTKEQCKASFSLVGIIVQKYIPP